MAVKSIVVECNWCHSEAHVVFGQDDDTEIFSAVLLPDENWFHLEHDGDEYDFCCKDCVQSHLA